VTLGQRAQIARTLLHPHLLLVVVSKPARATSEWSPAVCRLRHQTTMGRVDSLKELTLSFIVRNRSLLGARCHPQAAASKAQSCHGPATWRSASACLHYERELMQLSLQHPYKPRDKTPVRAAGDLGDVDLDSAQRILHHCNVEQLRTIENETAWGVISHSLQFSKTTAARPWAPRLIECAGWTSGPRSECSDGQHVEPALQTRLPPRGAGAGDRAGGRVVVIVLARPVRGKARSCSSHPCTTPPAQSLRSSAAKGVLV
jgi:hypothetical protein